MAMCDENVDAADLGDVPDYELLGFEENLNQFVVNPEQIAEVNSTLQDVKALNLKVCVGAKYDKSKKTVCFNVPIYGNLCVKVGISIPINAQIKVCAETCGRFIPTGLKATIYVNNNKIWSGKVVGSC
jgi:hypothetical protein